MDIIAILTNEILYYIFFAYCYIAVIGPDASRVEDSLYGQNGYWPLNFNDMPSGMVTMFTLLSVNNMHITTRFVVVVVIIVVVIVIIIIVVIIVVIVVVMWLASRVLLTL